MKYHAKYHHELVLLFWIMLITAFWPFTHAIATPEDVVVGDGTAASCDGNALEAAVAMGGVITFNCGGEHTILANTMVIEAGNHVTLDGGGLITVSGEDLRQIFIVNAGANLTLNNIVLSNGAWPGRGGAMVVYGQAELNNSTVRNSQSPCLVCDGSDGIGGAIAVEAGGALTVVNSWILNNQAGDSGGGVALWGGVATLRNSRLEGNSAGNAGGAIWTNVGASLTLIDSSVVNNVAGNADQGRGGGLYNQGDAAISRSTFSANRAYRGGGLALAGGNTVLENVTVSGNSAGSSSAGILSSVALGEGSVKLVHVTLYGNLYLDSNANLAVDIASEAPQLQNTIIQGVIDGQNCYLGVNPVSLGYNQSSDASCGLTEATDIQNANVALAPLADNGGATQTHLATTGSSVVDAIPADLCTVVVDQRNLPRPQGPKCDAGAVEGVPTTPPPLPANQPYYLGKIFVRPIDLPIFTIKPNIAATQLEITQGIQEADGLGVTLVAGKRTYVRLHVRKTSGSADPVVGARLWRIVGGQRVGDPILPSTRPNLFRFVPYLLGGNRYIVDPTVTVRASPDRNALSDSFFFRLPDSWTTAGTLTIEAEVNPTFLPNAVDEATRTDNILRTSFTFENTPTMVLRLFSVRYRNNGTIYAPTETQLREVEDWLRRAYPIARLIVKRDTEDMTNLNRIPTCDEVNGRLFWDNLFLKWAGIDPTPTRYFGLVADASSSVWMRGCAADIPSFIASGPTGDPNNHSFSVWDKDNDGESYGDWYTGHELAHTWGRSHVACRGDEGGPDTNYPMGENGSIGRLNSQNQYWGFDVYLRGPIVYPPTWKDVMTYCNNQWISAYTYEGIRSRLVSENAAAVQSGSSAAPLADYLVVQGAVTPAGPSATLDEIYRLTAPSLLASSAPGIYAIRLLGAGGAILANYPFTPRVDTEAPDDQTKPLLFVEQVLFVAGTQKIQVVSGNAVLAERSVSVNAPTVTVTAPAGGETVGAAGLTVRWRADDLDNDPLVATVLYSRDGGATYAPLRLHLSASEVVIPAAELGGATQGKVRVIVSDGVNTTQAESAGFFSVPNQPPLVEIIAPEADTTFGYGQLMPLAGSAVDQEDATLPDAAYQWYSDVDGYLGAGPTLDADLETIGDHTIRLYVTDADGATGVAQRTIHLSNDVMIPAAAMIASPIATNFVATAGSTTVQTQTVSLRNPQESALTWQATSDASWLSMTRINGVTPADVELRVDPAGLTAGDYVGVVTINSSGPGGALPPQQVRVSLTVFAPADAGQKLYLPAIQR